MRSRWWVIALLCAALAPARVWAQDQHGSLWTGGRRLRDLLDRLERAETQGLDSSDYGISRLRRLAQQPADSDSVRVLELLATVTLRLYASDLVYGRVVPEQVDTMWSVAPRRADLADHLGLALDSDRVGPTLDALVPSQADADRLRAALAGYQAIADRGGWPGLPAGPALQAGDTGARVSLLRWRLEMTGDLVTDAGGQGFDSAVARAVRDAQRRHGLVPDGVVGPATRAALNVPVQDRIRQLDLNLERWRWMPRDLGRRYLMVNTAGFSIELVDADHVEFAGRIVAGRVDWPTPIVSARLTDVTFSPVWNIPRSIAIQEVLPTVRRDPDYLTREGIHVMSDTTDQAVELASGAVAWDTIADSTFALRLWQEPGSRNPLGRIRFTIPNRFGVALHDTRSPQLFDALTRAFSHGCVRVADAERLAIYVLRDSPGWTPDWIRAAARAPTEWRVAVSDSIPTYLVYWTAWVDRDGTVQFRSDLYGWDEKLEEALSRRVRAVP